MMRSAHLQRRLVALTTISASLALATASTVVAYPISPEGEPLHLEAGVTPTLPGAGADAVRSDPATFIPANAVPVQEIATDDTDWVATVLTAMTSLALLALAVAAFTLTGRRRDPTSGDLT